MGLPSVRRQTFSVQTWFIGVRDPGVSPDPLPFPYSSTIYVGNTQNGYSAYYLEHEDFYWWSAEIREDADSVITIIKNGNPIVELDLETSETTHYYNGSKRSAMDNVAKVDWQ